MKVCLDSPVFKKLCCTAFLLLSITTSIFAAIPYIPIQFPRDEAAHYSTYQTNQLNEWWYCNGKLVTEKGKTFSYIASLNYVMVTGIYIPFIQFQLTDIEHQKTYTQSDFYSVTPDQFRKSFSETTLSSSVASNKTAFSIEQIDHNDFHVQSSIRTDDNQFIQLDLHLRPVREVLFINNYSGYMINPKNESIYYYSYPHLETSGHFCINQKKYSINIENSNSWLDHEWGDFMLYPWQSLVHPWLWQSIRLDNGIDINLAVEDPSSPFSKIQNASIILPDNTRCYLTDFTLAPTSVDPQTHYPTAYHLNIPSIALDVDIVNAYPNASLVGISETFSTIEGFYQGRPVGGYTYSESTLTY